MSIKGSRNFLNLCSKITIPIIDRMYKIKGILFPERTKVINSKDIKININKYLIYFFLKFKKIGIKNNENNENL